MNTQLLDKIEQLIPDCPKDWATKAATKMKTDAGYVRQIRRAERGKNNNAIQIKLILALKSVIDDEQKAIQQAIA